MSLEKNQIETAVDSLVPEMQIFLSHLIQIPSESGKEARAMDYIYDYFSEIGTAECQKIALSNSLKNDADYSCPIEGIEYDGRYNIRVTRKDSRSGKKLLLNAHVDTVPPSEGMEMPYSGKIENGIVWGRGACDDKGSIAAIYLLFKTLEQLNVKLPIQLAAHLVVEEENGGNGSLAMARVGERADGCIIMEPTEAKVLSSVRGAVWFNIKFYGKAGHSGQAGKTQSALSMARETMNALEEYHKILLADSKGIDLFDKYQNPMPLTFGRLDAGNWPAAAPNFAILEGVLGFLPNKSKEQICDEFEQVLLNECECLNENNFNLTFTYKHGCSVVGAQSELPQSLLKAAKQCGHETQIDAMPASCDAWFYNNHLKIPTVVFGPGTLSVAHSKDEHIKLSEIADAVKVLVTFVLNYYGEIS